MTSLVIRIWRGFEGVEYLHRESGASASLSDRKKEIMKLNIDFILIDESVVLNGFRALMSGAQLEAFKANPVMNFMHIRPIEDNNDNDVILVIGKWYDIRVQGSQLLGKPEFDDDDEFAQKIQKKVQKGYYNAASIWIDPISTSDDTTLMLPGQIGPTVTQWGLFEASIVDIPNCRNALAIRNSAGKKIQLSGQNTDSDIIDYLKTLKPKNKTMNKELLALLGLKENASEAEMSQKLAAMIQTNQNNAQLSAKNTELKNELEQIRKEQAKTNVESLVDAAIAEKKLAAGDRDKFVKLATADFDTTKAVIDGMKAYESAQSKLGEKKAGNETEIAELMKLSGHDLYVQDKLERLKAISEEHFKLKYKEAFGIEYKSPL